VTAQLEGRGIRDADVLRAMRETPRHLFVPESVRPMAYGDHPVPIGHGATISQPYIVALMTQVLRCHRTHRILEIGTGSGYQAAILSQLAAYVYTIEVVPELAESARQRLRQLAYSNVTVRTGDGHAGWPEEAPFDRIIVTAAPEELPESLVDQLANGGRLLAPVGSRVEQTLLLVEKMTDGTVQRRAVSSVLFIPMVRPGKGDLPSPY
jgi:protein-L-isoaspartate(D-aspartate) O-methyltransferase